MKPRTLFRLALGAALAVAGATPCLAASAGGAPADDFAIVPDEELAQARGGFNWQGVEIGLGAEIRTYLDGNLVLQTNISWSASGAQRSQVVSGALTAADAAQLQAGILSGGGIRMQVGGQSVFLANGGQTAIFHDAEGTIQNVLINRASNITARQEIDVALDLHNFGQFQAQMTQSRVVDAIGDAMGLASFDALGH
ncbi:MAG TPA: hypothetical protein VFM42_08380 [Sphingomicrobium sp.]|nr:hypothetical protein [Sphingomicrobium sp.]